VLKGQGRVVAHHVRVSGSAIITLGVVHGAQTKFNIALSGQRGQLGACGIVAVDSESS
jgi:hypothetical protein